MRQSRKRRTRLVRLLLAASLLMCFAGCETVGPMADVRCPQPNTAEIDDYAVIVEADPDRASVRWIGRVIGYCFPDESDERRGESP